ncbi:MAG: glycosyltransferase family 4 protein [Proteobacteria bacterium]|nr:glycosyltransferase family 4 protein [Pseudomonadota bacterium]
MRGASHDTQILKDMKVCLLNTFDQVGGAARACQRLYDGLSCSGADVKFLVREKSGTDQSIEVCGSRRGGHLRALLDGLILHRYPQRQLHNFSPAFMPACAVDTVNRFNPDIAHLHWIPQGFVRIEDLQMINAPIVWTLHDSWPFAGGCHLPGDCRRYEEQCGKCPVLGSGVADDLSRRVWKRRRDNYPLSRMTFVAPSRWLAEKAQSSSLLQDCRVEVIPNGVDTSLYSPGDRAVARTSLGLPPESRIILFGARHALSDPNKGVDLLWRALEALPLEIRSQCVVVTFGEKASKLSASVDITVINYGEVEDESKIVSLYQAADLFVMTSRQENLPNMIAEAMSCGLPCVAFAVGGIPEQISHRVNGCLVEPYDTDVMSSEIDWLLRAEDKQGGLGRMARAYAQERYSLQKVALQHIALYEKVLRSAHADGMSFSS